MHAIRHGGLLLLLCATTFAQRPASTPFKQLIAQADAARESNQLPEAIRLYQRALKLNPRSAEAWWYLGTAHYSLDQFADAAVALHRSAQLSPKIGATWVLLGLSEARLGKDKDALAHLQRGRQLGGGKGAQLRPIALFQEGHLLLRASDFEQAQQVLRELARDGGQPDEVLFSLGAAALRIREPEAISADTTRAAILQAGRAEQLAADGKDAEAIAAYEALASAHPQLPNVHYAHARCRVLSREPDPEQIVAAFKRELQRDPDHVPALLGVASVRVSTAPEVGLQYAEKALRLSPKLPLAHYIMGLLLLELDQAARAIPHLETARSALHDEPRVYFALGRAYAKTNRKAEAAQARARFKQLSANQPADQPPSPN